MKRLRHALLLASSLFLALSTNAQSTLNTTQLGHLPYTQDLSEVRGAYHNGHEYAFVGVKNGLSIVDVTNPSTPTEVFFEFGPNSVWRDPFYHNGHAYCVTEGGGGLLIVDMSPLPTSPPTNTTLYTGSTYPFQSSHNLFIEEATNKAYIFGTDNIEGVIILDISDPMNPVELGVWNDYYIHDGFVRGDTLWASCLEYGTFVVDVSLPNTPQVLAVWDTPSEVAHNVWPSDDNAYCFTTDEVSSGYIAAYDMSNFQNVVETDRAHHPLSVGVIPHNTHYHNGYVVTSHYRDGLTIHDVSDPSNMVLTGYFDSSPLSGNGFNGAWGTWPYLPSGNILVSDIEEGLFIVSADYTRAARIQGNVTELGSGSPLNAVQIEVVGAGLNESTNLFGNYATGTATAGTYDVTFQKGGYIPQTISNVVLTNGQTIILDVELVPDVPFTLSGTVTELGSGLPIEGATVFIENEFFSKELVTDQNGNYNDNDFYAGIYDVTVGAWGYIGQCFSTTFSQSTPPTPIELEVGYKDDFSLDLGWTVSGNASAGVWERGAPIGTTFDGQLSNPDSHAVSECGNQAYITGNGGGSAGNDDVDDGSTILTSPPLNFMNYAAPSIQFDYWFFNAGGSGNPNDVFDVKVDDGTSITTIASLSTTNSQWRLASLPLPSTIATASSVNLIFEASDLPPGHLVEAGLDNFMVVETVGTAENENAQAISIFPNPASRQVNIHISHHKGAVHFTDLAGRKVGNSQQLTQGINQVQVPNKTGIYLCEVIVNNHRKVERLLVYP